MKQGLKDFFKKSGSALAVPLIMIAIGLFMTMWSDAAVKMIVQVFGVIFLVVGVVIACTLLAAYSKLTMVMAVVLAIFGILCITFADSLSNFVMKLTGLSISVNALIRIYDAYKVKGNSDHFSKYMINDLVSLGLGLLLILIPTWFITKYAIVAGILLVFLGVTNLVTAIKVYRDGRYVNDGTDVVWEE